MTISFEPSLPAQVGAGLSAAEFSLTDNSPAPLNFANVLTSRAMLEGAPELGASVARTPSAERTEAAPAAVRFDAGPLFGRFTQSHPLQRLAALNSDSLSMKLDESGATGLSAVRGSSDAGTVIDGPAATMHSPPGHQDKTFSLTLRGSAKSSSETEMASGSREWMTAATDEELRGVSQHLADTSFAAARFVSIHLHTDTTAPVLSPGPVSRGLTARGLAAGKSWIPADQPAGARLAEARARYVDVLGPVQIVAREASAAVELTIRIGMAATAVSGVLERRVREVVAEEGRVLSRLRINGSDYQLGAEVTNG